MKKTHERDEARRSRDGVLKAPDAAAVNRGRANKQYPRRRLIRIVYIIVAARVVEVFPPRRRPAARGSSRPLGGEVK